MKSIKEVVTSVVDSFFELSDQDKAVYLSKSDSQILGDAIDEALAKEGY